MDSVVEFVVRFAEPWLVDEFKVSWKTELGSQGCPTRRILHNILESAYGVERVYMRRYSAEIEVASHVVGHHEALEYIKDALEDPELLCVIREHLPGIETVVVTIEPSLLGS